MKMKEFQIPRYRFSLDNRITVKEILNKGPYQGDRCPPPEHIDFFQLINTNPFYPVIADYFHTAIKNNRGRLPKHFHVFILLEARKALLLYLMNYFGWKSGVYTSMDMHKHSLDNLLKSSELYDYFSNVADSGSYQDIEI